MAEIIAVDQKRPAHSVIRKAAAVIRAGGVVIFPTETLYGVGANAFNAAAVKKVFTLKRRPARKPLLVLIATHTQLRRFVSHIPPVASSLIGRFWPGPLTIVFKKKKGLRSRVTAGGSTIALRFSSHPVAQALIKASGVPLTAPSANISGAQNLTSGKEVVRAFGNDRNVTLILDAGKVAQRIPSTIVDVTKNPPALLREGTIKKEQLFPRVPLRL